MLDAGYSPQATSCKLRATSGELEAHFRRSGTPLPTPDLLIGTTAKALGLPLLARDPGHYALIPGLAVET